MMPFSFFQRIIWRIMRRDRLYRNFVHEAESFCRLLCQYNASVGTDDDIEKMQYTLLRENHVIEKGMSLREPRIGFGQRKVMALIERLFNYAERYLSVDSEFLRYPLGTIAEYIDFTKKRGVAIDNIESAYAALIERCKVYPDGTRGGVRKEGKREVCLLSAGAYSSCLKSRHSVRYFKMQVGVSRNKLEEALELAQTTPSACNRQAWKTHVYFDNDSINLAKWQGGCRGFEDEIRCSIVVTANLKGFLWHEAHQAYVDGGLYAMNLINSLHSIGLGTIPLSLGFSCDKLKELDRFGIPANEVPIIIIGCGELEDEFKVAISTRKPISRTNTFHSAGSVVLTK